MNPQYLNKLFNVQTYDRISHTKYHFKSIEILRAVEEGLSRGIFDQQCVILKVLLELIPKLKQHMVVIGVYQKCTVRTIYKNKCLENRNKLYAKSESFNGIKFLKQ